MNKTKFIALLLLLCLSLSMVVYASTEKVEIMHTSGLSPVIPEHPGYAIGTRGVDPPSKSDVYSNNTWVTVNGSANYENLYTKMCFYDVSKIEYSITNYRSTTLTQTLYRYYALIGYTSVSSSKINGNSTGTGSFTDLNNSYYYFLKYTAPVNATGQLKGTK